MKTGSSQRLQLQQLPSEFFLISLIIGNNEGQFQKRFNAEKLCAKIWSTKLGHRRGSGNWVWPSMSKCVGMVGSVIHGLGDSMGNE